MSTVYKQIVTDLNKWSPFVEFINNKTKREDYLEAIIEGEDGLLKSISSINMDKLHLTTRFPLDIEKFVDEILFSLVNDGVIPTAKYDKDFFYEYKKDIDLLYDHLEYQTYIFPEEELLLFALSQILNPKNVIFMGSYYGYWGIWLMPIIKNNKGKAYFVDTDSKVNNLTKKNMINAGFEKYVEVITDDAVDFLRNTKQKYDIGILDAECSPTHSNPEYRGKRIYYPLIKEFYPKLIDGGFVLAHNILLSNSLNDEYFNEKIKNNNDEFKKYLEFTNKNFSKCLDFETTEGVGIYQK